jgi:hypothetical protein
MEINVQMPNVLDDDLFVGTGIGKGSTRHHNLKTLEVASGKKALNLKKS